MLRLRTLITLLAMAVPAFAQFGPNPRGAALTHIHLNSADPDAAIAFWTEIIGTATYTRDSVRGASMLGALLVFDKKAPSGPSAGSAIDHLAMRVPDLGNFTEKLAKTKFKSFKPEGSDNTLMIDGPDGVRIELMEDNAMYAPLEFHHIHLNSPKPQEMQAWYGKFLGARAGTEDQANTSRLQGGMLTFSSAATVAPTAGRAIDHLSFEVRDLAAFSKTLSDGGVAVQQGAGSAVFVTDPWGTRIELTGASGK